VVHAKAVGHRHEAVAIGADFATESTPITVPAPGLFSTTMALAEGFGNLGGDEASHHIGGAARWERHNKPLQGSLCGLEMLGLR
jgi:hypothetical protein